MFLRSFQRTGGAEDVATEQFGRLYLVPAVIGALSVLTMVAFAIAYGLPIRDPDARYVGSPIALIMLIATVALLLDVLPRGWFRSRAEKVKLLRRLQGGPQDPLAQPARAGRAGQPRQLLRDLPLLPQPEELHPVRHRRQPRRRPHQLRARRLLRDRPRDDPARHPRDRRRGPRPLERLPDLPDLRSRVAGRRADLVQQAADRRLVRHRPVPDLGPRRRQLLRAAGARPDLRAP